MLGSKAPKSARKEEAISGPMAAAKNLLGLKDFCIGRLFKQQCVVGAQARVQPVQRTAGFVEATMLDSLQAICRAPLLLEFLEALGL